MKKTYYVIQVEDRLQASKLSLIRTWLRQYLMEHESETSINIQHDFHNFLEEMYRKDFYDIFREPEKYKFVYLDVSEESGDSLPRFKMHKRMFSTFIQASNRKTKVKTDGE